MNQKIWDLYAPIYERAMRADKKVYQYMYDRILQVITGKEVLEIATGPGLLAKHIAGAAKRIIATNAHQWSAAGYEKFLEQNCWRITYSKELEARVTLVYTECVRNLE